MRLSFQSASAFLFGNLGTCSRCMRKAFLAAASAWAILASAAIIGSTTFIFPIFLVALALTLLWAGHLIALTRKATIAVDGSSENKAVTSGYSRREALPLFIRTLAIAALVSAAPRMALADGACGADNCDPCFRPLYARDGTRVCQRCHSCAGADGRYNCGGATC